MAKMGRPTLYTEQLIDEICNKIATSTEGLQHICDANEKYPDMCTLMRWLGQYPYFRDKYARAREQQADLLADMIIQVAEKSLIGETTTEESYSVEDQEGNSNPVTKSKKVKGDNVQRSRLVVDAYKWKASKLAPKKYGDKIEITGIEKTPGADLSGLTYEQLLELTRNNSKPSEEGAK